VQIKAIKWWSFVYALIFAPLSFLFVRDNFENNYHWGFIALSIVLYLLMNLGNFTYALAAAHDNIRRPWKVIAPCLVLYFLAEEFIDQRLGHYAGAGLHEIFSLGW
jgi:hypothetical protein